MMEMMEIKAITHLGGQNIFILSNGEGITRDVIDGNPSVGRGIVKEGERYRITGNNVNPDCPNGVCPIK